MEDLKSMKKALISCVQSQIHGNLKEVDAEELGEAVDMIKDLEEAIYYATITKAMEDGDKEKKEHSILSMLIRISQSFILSFVFFLFFIPIFHSFCNSSIINSFF